MHTGALLGELPDHIYSEIFDEILSTDKIRIERILSQGQFTPKGEWLEQKEHELVVLIKGAATLSIEDPVTHEAELVRLGPSDYINLPAYRRHRVEWTDPKDVTVWLAIYY